MPRRSPIVRLVRSRARVGHEAFVNYNRCSTVSARRDAFRREGISHSLFRQESNVRISVFNIPGEKVKDLVNEQKTSETHAIIFNADNLASGIYFYRVEAGSTTKIIS